MGTPKKEREIEQGQTDPKGIRAIPWGQPLYQAHFHYLSQFKDDPQSLKIALAWRPEGVSFRPWNGIYDSWMRWLVQPEMLSCLQENFFKYWNVKQCIISPFCMWEHCHKQPCGRSVYEFHPSKLCKCSFPHRKNMLVHRMSHTSSFHIHHTSLMSCLEFLKWNYM